MPVLLAIESTLGKFLKTLEQRKCIAYILHVKLYKDNNCSK